MALFPFVADAFERVNVIGLPARWSELDCYGEKEIRGKERDGA